MAMMEPVMLLASLDSRNRMGPACSHSMATTISAASNTLVDFVDV